MCISSVLEPIDKRRVCAGKDNVRYITVQFITVYYIIKQYSVIAYHVGLSLWRTIEAGQTLFAFLFTFQASSWVESSFRTRRLKLRLLETVEM